MNIENDYIQRLVGVYEILKVADITEVEAFKNAAEAVNKIMQLQYKELTKEDIDELCLKAYNRIVGFSFPKDTEIIVEDSDQSWFTEDSVPKYRQYWPRYKNYLIQYKNWHYGLAESIDKATNEILANLGDPNSTKPFDKRGLVLGHVQSGKTANFTGLINKAFDVGYKLVIVLAGMHNDLRSQTQLRLNKEVIGVGVDNTEVDGVGKVSDSPKLIESWTSVQQDIISNSKHGVKSLDKSLILVVKKQQDVLNNLIDILDASMKIEKKKPPVLIIDDEADQASVNGKKDEDPATINRLIRQLLNLFEKSSYVGYTATPFANLLINTDVSEFNLAENISMDLYPKDFVIALPEPPGYCGPATFFNTKVDSKDNRLFIRFLSKADEEMFESIKQKSDADLFNSVPETMQEAIKAFLIVIAIRNLRGQINEHNSMLIHVSRFTDSQNNGATVINNFYKTIKDKILADPDPENELAQTIKEIYEEDFIDTQRSFKSLNLEKELTDIYEWDKVYDEIRSTVEKIQVMSINGESKDALEYEKYKKEGLNVIAIGGNKLSRGITLEGLSISYYYRLSNMYDTLLQMGRWFGFREGYLDLCRIYTVEEIADHFSHLAEVMTDLRKEFTNLVEAKIKPSEYAIKILSHEKMKLTSQNRMKHATKLINYTGTLQQTRLFEKTSSFYTENMRAAENFINDVEEFVEKTDGGKKSTKYHVALDVPTEKIIAFLKEYKTSPSASKVTSEKIKNYIEICNSKGAFKKFNVVVVDITPSTLDSKEAKAAGIEKWPVKLGKLNVESATPRSIKGDKSNPTGNVKDIGAIVSANQEFADILNKTTDKTTNLELRNQNNPALLVYPLHPSVETFASLEINFTDELVPIGLAFSFPSQVIDEKGRNIQGIEKEYMYNDTVKDNV